MSLPVSYRSYIVASFLTFFFVCLMFVCSLYALHMSPWESDVLQRLRVPERLCTHSGVMTSGLFLLEPSDGWSLKGGRGDSTLLHFLPKLLFTFRS